MPKRCQLNQERGIEKREHREKISLNERTGQNSILLKSDP